MRIYREITAMNDLKQFKESPEDLNKLNSF